MVKESLFGKMPDGREVKEFVIENKKGMQLHLIEFGATMKNIIVNDKNGGKIDVVLGQDDLEGYTSKRMSLAASTIGRYANRIANGRFVIDGKETALKIERGKHVLHSGAGNYGLKLFEGKAVGENSVIMHYHDSGEGGFGNEAEFSVTFTLSDEGEVIIEYSFTPEEKTIFNPTNHAYFNLSGEATVLEQTVQINADYYTPADEDLIPTGELASVKGTPLDFNSPKTIGEAIEYGITSGFFGKFPGFDNNFAINGSGWRKAAEAWSEKSGVKMEVFTELPGMQVFTPSFDFSDTGKHGKQYVKNCAFCMETHHMPNAVNIPSFPSPVCEAGKTVKYKTIYKFDTI